MKEPKRPDETLTDMQRVFGADVTFDDTGNPIEHGVGSMPVVGKWEGQRRPFPTRRPTPAAQKQTDEQMVFLHRMIAASVNAELARAYHEFLQWLKKRGQTKPHNEDREGM